MKRHQGQIAVNSDARPGPRRGGAEDRSPLRSALAVALASNGQHRPACSASTRAKPTRSTARTGSSFKPPPPAIAVLWAGAFKPHVEL